MIKKMIAFRVAARGIMAILSLLVLFHLAVIAGIVLFDYAPVDFLWGGRLETAEELLRFEIVSFLISLVALFFVAIRVGLLHMERLQKAARVVMWLLFVLFLLNTIGNIVAESRFEKFFAIVTIVLALFSLRLALKK
jgi:hypothetical protein